MKSLTSPDRAKTGTDTVSPGKNVAPPPSGMPVRPAVLPERASAGHRRPRATSLASPRQLQALRSRDDDPDPMADGQRVSDTATRPQWRLPTPRPLPPYIESNTAQSEPLTSSGGGAPAGAVASDICLPSPHTDRATRPASAHLSSLRPLSGSRGGAAESATTATPAPILPEAFSGAACATGASLGGLLETGHALQSDLAILRKLLAQFEAQVVREQNLVARHVAGLADVVARHPDEPRAIGARITGLGQDFLTQSGRLDAMLDGGDRRHVPAPASQSETPGWRAGDSWAGDSSLAQLRATLERAIGHAGQSCDNIGRILADLRRRGVSQDELAPAQRSAPVSPRAADTAHREDPPSPRERRHPLRKSLGILKKLRGKAFAAEKLSAAPSRSGEGAGHRRNDDAGRARTAPNLDTGAAVATSASVSFKVPKRPAARAASANPGPANAVSGNPAPAHSASADRRALASAGDRGARQGSPAENRHAVSTGHESLTSRSNPPRRAQETPPARTRAASDSAKSPPSTPLPDVSQAPPKMRKSLPVLAAAPRQSTGAGNARNASQGTPAPTRHSIDSKVFQDFQRHIDDLLRSEDQTSESSQGGDTDDMNEAGENPGEKRVTPDTGGTRDTASDTAGEAARDAARPPAQHATQNTRQATAPSATPAPARAKTTAPDTFRDTGEAGGTGNTGANQSSGLH